MHIFSGMRKLHWIEDGLSIVEVQFLLGHEQIGTTMKYLDIKLSAASFLDFTDPSMESLDFI